MTGKKPKRTPFKKTPAYHVHFANKHPGCATTFYTLSIRESDKSGLVTHILRRRKEMEITVSELN